MESQTKQHLCTPYWLAKVTCASILFDTVMVSNMINVQVLEIEDRPTERCEWAKDEEEDSDSEMCVSGTQSGAKLCKHYKVHFFTRKSSSSGGISGFEVGRLWMFD